MSAEPAAPLHRLLRRQLRRVWGAETQADGQWGQLLAAVSSAYQEQDLERQLLSNALDVNAQELTESNRKLQLFIDHAPVGIVMLDNHLRYLYASRRWLQDSQSTLHDIVGRDHYQHLPWISERAKVAHQKGLLGATEICEEDRLTLPSGQVEWYRWEVHPWFDAVGEVGGLIIMTENITSRKQAEEQLRIAAVAFQARDGMVVTDAAGVILQVNQAFMQVTGYSDEELVGKTLAVLNSGKHDAIFYRNLWEAIKREGRWEGRIWNRRKDGGIYPEWLSISSVKTQDGTVSHYVSTYSDVRELKEAERRIIELAFYDPLTQLPNRRLLLDRLQQHQSESRETGAYGALLLLDLDHFKTLNDTRGHGVGDMLLIEIARRLREHMGTNATAARLGGDEFVVLMEGLPHTEQEATKAVQSAARRLLSVICEPAMLEGQSHVVTSSVGITLFSGKTQDSAPLLKQADLALYYAKNDGRNTWRLYETAMQEAADARAMMEVGMRQALLPSEHPQLSLHYQAQLDAQGSLFGAEALLRWQDRPGHYINPSEFIPVAEDSGLIVDIGRWVLLSACQQLSAWARLPGHEHLTLAINVSVRQLREADFVDMVIQALNTHSINPSRLTLEITESLLLDDVEHVIAMMNALKAVGVCFSIDDFGTGYSSLAYLSRLPVNQLKIDRSFVSGLDTYDNTNSTLVKAIISMGRSLGFQVLAEGVETQAQHQRLLALGCDAFQGYLFGKPGPAQALQTWLAPSGGAGLSQP